MKMHTRSKKSTKPASRAARKRGAPAKKGAQVTIRNVPAHVQAGFRRRAREQGKSLNAVMVEALSKDFDAPGGKVYHDLDDLIGTWVEDPKFDEAIAAQDQIDEELWK